MSFFVPFWAVWFIVAIIIFVVAGIVLKNSTGSGSLSVSYYDPIGMFVGGALLTGGLVFVVIGVWELVK